MGVHPVTQQARAYKLSTRQRHDDAGTVITNCAFRPDGEPRTLHAMPVAASTARKVKILKSGIRRISYK
jgi:hypothetical protein